MTARSWTKLMIALRALWSDINKEPQLVPLDGAEGYRAMRQAHKYAKKFKPPMQIKTWTRAGVLHISRLS